MNNQTQLELSLHTEPKPENTDMVKAAIAARAELYQIMANNLRKEVAVLNGRIERLDSMVAYFSHVQ
jgi:hypothetical protein